MTGTYLELREPQYTYEREHAQKQLAQHSRYWQNPLAERREQTSDLAMELVFFRLDIVSMSGLRATPEGEWRQTGRTRIHAILSLPISSLSL